MEKNEILNANPIERIFKIARQEVTWYNYRNNNYRVMIDWEFN